MIQVMVIGFQGVGIKLSGCGAGYVHDSWVGQYESGFAPPLRCCISFAGAF